MRNVALTSLLLGALAASSAFNVYHAVGASGATVPSAVREEASVPQSEAGCPLIVKVELTTAQRREFAKCCATYAQQCAQFCRQIDSVTAELEKELSAENPDAQRIYELADELGQARAAELKARIGNILLVRKTLTPRQLERLAGCCAQKCVDPQR